MKDNILGENIRRYRLDEKWSQAELAKKLGYNKRSVSNWELNLTDPTLDTLIAMAKLFGITVDDLLTK